MKKIDIKSIITVVLYFLIFQLLAYVISRLMVGDKQLSADEAVFYNIILNLIVYVIALACIVPLCFKSLITEDIQVTKKIGVGKTFAYIIVGYLASLVLTSVGTSISYLISGDTSSTNQEGIEAMLHSPYAFLSIICIVIIGPIVEELVFRKAIFGIFEKLNLSRIIPLIISALLFGSIHVISGGDWAMVFPYIFMGLGFGLIYFKKRSIYINIGIHVLNNLMSVIGIYVLSYLEEFLEQFYPDLPSMFSLIFK